MRPGTEQEWQARCGDKYIPVGAGRYAAELGSDSDEANDACARRRNCMEQRVAYGYTPAPRGRPRRAPAPAPETPQFGAVFSVCCPQCGHSFPWPPPEPEPSDTDTDQDEGTSIALGIIAGGF